MDAKDSDSIVDLLYSDNNNDTRVIDGWIIGQGVVKFPEVKDNFMIWSNLRISAALNSLCKLKKIKRIGEGRCATYISTKTNAAPVSEHPLKVVHRKNKG